MKKSQMIIGIIGLITLIVGLVISNYIVDFAGLAILTVVLMSMFGEKHNLIKITLCMILLTVVLSWIIPQGYFNAGELVKNDITRVGIFDFVTYGLLGMYYFTVLVTFLFVLGAFYQFLSKLGAYQKLTDKISKRWKGKEILFSLIISFVFAVLASMVNEYLIILAFVPFVITILSKLNVDKIGSFVTTFGAILVGILGSTISTKVAGMNIQYFGLKYTDNLLDKILMFVIAYAIYSLFNVMHLKKTLASNKTSKSSKAKKETKEIVNEDLFSNAVKGSDKSNTIPLIVVGVIAILVTVLAYIPWNTVFGVDWFSTALTKVNETNLFGVPIFSYILGNISEFGAWDLFGVQVVMLISIVVLQICYKVSMDDTIEAFGEGFKKVSKLVLVLLLAYVILEFAVMYPVIPTILGSVLGSKFNVFTTSIAGIVTGLFTSEYQYAVNLLYSFFTTSYANNLNVVSIILQSTYGLVSFFAPSSAMLLVGLSYLDIPYKDWMKYIWKFLVAMLVVIIVMAFIIA